ncbi:hypothetical protein PB2503_00777 [Parvularcula bermudensis HTCC2503]|uniref:Uncharacterized protein n=1 Tax=Parvularcula bermudensis (strain ATCC BAA-594 / HTCC2503 / KCTC 12087) TaxID=314260 RepID=E0TB27_PARBH|nr:hypothetical protein [Parvularcula bermudensis]ADM08236.1 hypothetical protein PB2503_00777 [Parvularcula bermudensis HTCC2503]
MAYGDRKTHRLDGGYGVFDKFGFGIAAALGIAVATFIDMTQSNEASALFLFGEWVTRISNAVGLGPIPLYVVVLLLMLIGALSIFYFQPITFRGAFAQGFGALAAIMTIAPSDMGAPLPGLTGALPTSNFIDDLPPAGDGGNIATDEISFRPYGGARLVPLTFSQTQSTTTDAETNRARAYELRIKVVLPNGISKDISKMAIQGGLRGRLNVEGTRTTYNLFRNSGAEVDYRDNAMYFSTSLPGVPGRDTLSLAARIEIEGYQITEERFEAQRGANPVWEIQMQPSRTPLYIQRLRTPYRF